MFDSSTVLYLKSNANTPNLMKIGLYCFNEMRQFLFVVGFVSYKNYFGCWCSNNQHHTVNGAVYGGKETFLQQNVISIIYNIRLM